MRRISESAVRVETARAQRRVQLLEAARAVAHRSGADDRAVRGRGRTAAARAISPGGRSPSAHRDARLLLRQTSDSARPAPSAELGRDPRAQAAASFRAGRAKARWSNSGATGCGRALRSTAQTDAWHIGFWPDGAQCCIVLTHDVESPQGLRADGADGRSRRAARFPLGLEPAAGAISRSTGSRVARLRARGFEFGAHGLSHDGRLFRSRSRLCRARAAPGAARRRTRSPRLPRALDAARSASGSQPWSFDFDSSFSDTDPYEPQPGGTCSLFPFHLSRHGRIALHAAAGSHPDSSAAPRARCQSGR